MKPNKPFFSEMLSAYVCLSWEGRISQVSLRNGGRTEASELQELWVYKGIKGLRRSGWEM